MKEDDKMVVKRRFDRIYNAMENMAYTSYEYFPENKEIFVYGFKHIKTDKVDTYLGIGLGSDDIYENEKLFNFWSNKIFKLRYRNEKVQNNRFAFHNAGKKITFLKSRAYVCS